MRALSVAFTGHRPESLPCGSDMDSDAYFHLQTLVWKEIIRYIDAGCKTFYCGAARGVDIMCGEIILAEKATGHTVEELLAHKEVNSAVKEYLLREYGVQNMSDRIAQQLITLPVAINTTVFKAAWTHLNSDERVSLMMRCLDILEADDFERYFSDLGGEYSCFVDRSKKRSVVTPDTTESRKLMDRLQRVDYITSWKESEKKGKTSDSELIVWIKQKR